MNEDLIQALYAAKNSEEKAALIGEAILNSLPREVAMTARQCVLFHWFNLSVVTKLIQPERLTFARRSHIQVQEIYRQIISLPFVEEVPWGVTFQHLTRQGLLNLYVQTQTAMLLRAARLAAPVYVKHPAILSSMAEGMFCYIVSGDVKESERLLYVMLEQALNQQNWQQMENLFNLQEEAEKLSSFEPLPRTEQYWMLRSAVDWAQGQLDRAIVDFGQTLTNNPSNALAYICRSIIYTLQDQPERALTDYQEAQRLDPALVQSYIERGIVFPQQHSSADKLDLGVSEDSLDLVVAGSSSSREFLGDSLRQLPLFDEEHVRKDRVMQKEAKARIKINKILQEAGWRFFDDEYGKANIVLEPHVKIREKDIDAFGNDFEKTKHGYIDFLFLDNNGYPYAVLEAKSEDKSPLDGKEQARKYAKSQNVRFIILSNGNLHYFWDLERGNPTIITTFPTPDSLENLQGYAPNPKKLADEIVKEDYIILTQHPTYTTDPRWIDETTRQDFIKDQGLKFLRPYQLRAIQALQEAAWENKDRYLFEMATGTGKTLIAAAVIKLFLKSGNAKRVLFLVDRLELEDQAWKQFVGYLKNDYRSVIYKENRDDWRKAEIVVTTVQSLSFNNKYQKLYSPTDFDLIISDEAHRSIGGNSRAVFEYFIGYKLGLTATPKDYLKRIDEGQLNEKDPREWERRQLLDTYKTFGCERGTPTFRFSLVDGVQEGYLVNPIVADARTDITTELLSEKGYSLMVETDEGLAEPQTFFQRDFEKKFFSEETNRMFCKTFVENALRDPISGEIGKSIIFCVSQVHALKITQILNEFADALFPGKYQSDFAVQVTSNISDAQQFTINFTNNNLNGHTNFLDGYESSKTRVCVTVGMMTTGYDCEDILNLCLLRPIFSPTDFIQMKGRGTRKYTFSYTSKETGTVDAQKATFKLFDFFANCEYFEEKFNYDEVLELPHERTGAASEIDLPGVTQSEVIVITPDPLKVFTETAIGLEGMKVDRKLFEKFEETVKSNPFIKKTYEEGDIDAVEEYVRAEVLNKPEEFITLAKLRQAIKADRRISLREFIENILEGKPTYKTKDELLEEEYEKFVSIYKPDSQDALGIKNFLKVYITDEKVREIIDKKQYGRLDAETATMTIDDFRALNSWRTIVPEYVKDYVSLNQFM